MWRHFKPILQVITLATAMMVSSLHGAVLENTTKCPVTFYLVHTIIPNYNWVTKILAHTHLAGILIPWNQKFQAFFVVYHYTAPYKKETKWRDKIVLVWVLTASCKPSIEAASNSVCSIMHANLRLRSRLSPANGKTMQTVNTPVYNYCQSLRPKKLICLSIDDLFWVGSVGRKTLNSFFFFKRQ